MPPVIVHQESNYTQDLHYKIPKDWLVHNTPSGYMDRDVRMKAMIHFKTVCGSKKINPQVLFYDGHSSHFDGRAIHNLCSNHIEPFVLEAGDSVNDQQNDNGLNLKQNIFYGQAIMD